MICRPIPKYNHPILQNAKTGHPKAGSSRHNNHMQHHKNKAAVKSFHNPPNNPLYELIRITLIKDCLKTV